MPEDLPGVTGGVIRVVATVYRNGRAQLQECNADQRLCEIISRGIAIARFVPAQAAGQSVACKVRIDLRVVPDDEIAPEATPGETATSAQPGEAPGSNAADDAIPALQWRARARATPYRQAGARRLELAEVRDLPGALGDPFRAVEALPGVTPVLSGLPYFFIRGAPPAGTLYVYDAIPLPTLYHLAIGPAVVHPRMVGPIRLYSGVAPARYGRLTGGVVVGEGPDASSDDAHAEAELRTLDVSGYVQVPVAEGSLTAAVRYGYPALLLSVVSPRVKLAYWDYQLRYGSDWTSATRFELVALGSYDSFRITTTPNASIKIGFHRLEPRVVHQTSRTEVGAALLFGQEQSMLGTGFELHSTRMGPRFWWEQRFSAAARLRLSSDMQAITGSFSRHLVSDEWIATDRPDLAGSVGSRSQWGVQAELRVWPWQALELMLGARGDAWVQAGAMEGSVDPRARITLHASDKFDLHAGVGLVHQPAVFFLPLPGIADVPSDRGLQTALQSEAGFGWDMPAGVRAEVQGFVHRYRNLMFTDAALFADPLEPICKAIDCKGAELPRRTNGLSYGTEVFLKRSINEHVSGFASYTLAWSKIDRVAGLPYTPSWDVRHVGNLALQWLIVDGLSFGGRILLRSGKTHGEFLIGDEQQLTRFEHRLPAFYRLDLELAYVWRPAWGRMRIALEWLNTTLAQEPQDFTCGGVPRTCRVNYLPTVYFPNLSIRGDY